MSLSLFYVYFLLLYAAYSNKLEITEHTKSPLKVQPNDQIVLFAEATASTTRGPWVTWQHGNTTYSDAISEDPFCPVNITHLVLYMIITYK